MVGKGIAPENDGREDQPYVCSDAPPVHHVLHLDLYARVVVRAVRVLGDARATRDRPHCHLYHLGLGAAARSWLPADPLPRRIDSGTWWP